MAKKAEATLVVKIKTQGAEKLKKIRDGLLSFDAAKNLIGAVTDKVKQFGGAIVDLGVKAGKFADAERAFNNLASGIGRDSKELLNNMRKATDGVVSDLSLMQQANKAALLGVPVDRIDDMLKVSRSAAKATGESMDFMMRSLVTAVGRSSPMILDNLLITLRLSEAYQDFADKNGVLVSRMTDVQKRQAFLDGALEKGVENIKKVGKTTDVTSDKWERFKAQTDNLTIAIGKQLVPALDELLDLMTKSNTSVESQAESWSFLGRLIDVARGRLQGYITLAKKAVVLGDAFKNLVTFGFRTPVKKEFDLIDKDHKALFNTIDARNDDRRKKEKTEEEKARDAKKLADKKAAKEKLKQEEDALNEVLALKKSQLEKMTSLIDKSDKDLFVERLGNDRAFLDAQLESSGATEKQKIETIKRLQDSLANELSSKRKKLLEEGTVEELAALDTRMKASILTDDQTAKIIKKTNKEVADNKIKEDERANEAVKKKNRETANEMALGFNTATNLINGNLEGIAANFASALLPNYAPAINAGIGLVKAIASSMGGSGKGSILGEWERTIKEMEKALEESLETMKEDLEEIASDLSDTLGDITENLENDLKQTFDDLGNAITDANADYEKNMENLALKFLAVARGISDKISDLNEQLIENNEEYAESIQELRDGLLETNEEISRGFMQTSEDLKIQLVRDTEEITQQYRNNAKALTQDLGDLNAGFSQSSEDLKVKFERDSAAAKITYSGDADKLAEKLAELKIAYEQDSADLSKKLGRDIAESKKRMEREAAAITENLGRIKRAYEQDSEDLRLKRERDSRIAQSKFNNDARSLKVKLDQSSAEIRGQIKRLEGVYDEDSRAFLRKLQKKYGQVQPTLDSDTRLLMDHNVTLKGLYDADAINYKSALDDKIIDLEAFYKDKRGIIKKDSEFETDEAVREASRQSTAIINAGNDERVKLDKKKESRRNVEGLGGVSTADITSGINIDTSGIDLLYSANGGAVGSDSVPALLTPGEFVVNRNDASKNLGLLEQINSGGSPGGSTTINLTVNGGMLGDAADARMLAKAIDEQLLELRQNNESQAFDSDVI